MKILNKIALLGLTILPTIGCSKKPNELIEQRNKVYDFEIKNLEKVRFWISNSTNNITQVQINKIDNNNLNEKLPELRNLENLSFLFTQKLQNNQSKQDKIRQLINTGGQETAMRNTWVINKKITIKAQGTNLDDCKYDSLGNISPAYDDNKIDYILRSTNDFEIEIENHP
ncbi:hypothetical protein [Spiroplasma endosymbiont of Nephrotoma flavescens]|uniref:hypothetical protein n=1 Tax=Spiroplasma endosymbiont of Nephrotoma flavescens TaxID=3066302 RepID=UPI00313D7410